MHWHELRGRGKFDRVLAFGDALPALRRRVRRDLALPGLPRNKVLALLVRLLDDTLIRIGNESYTRANHSYGLTTLRSRHVRAERGRLRFAFRGKSGQEREVELSGKRLARIVRRVQQSRKSWKDGAMAACSVQCHPTPRHIRANASNARWRSCASDCALTEVVVARREKAGR